MPDIPSKQDRPEIRPATSGSFKIPHQPGVRILPYQTPPWTAMAPLPGMAFRRKHDSKLTIEFVSTGSRELTGYDPSDLIENRTVSFMDIIHPSNLGLVKKTISQAFTKKSPFQHEYRIITATGQKKWVWEQGWWDLDDYGNAIAMEGFISDITICKSMAKDYPHWAEGFSSAADHFSEGILVIDDLFRIVFANQVSCIIFGWPVEQLIGRDFREFLSEESKQTVTDRSLRRDGDEPEDDNFEVIVVDAHRFTKRMFIKSAKISSWAGKAKTIIQILDLSDLQQGMIINGKIPHRGDYISDIRDANRLPIEIPGITRDITDLKETEQALQKREQEFRSMVANIPGVIYQFYVRNNGDLGLYNVSDRVLDLLGLDIKNLEGLFERFLSCVAPEDTDRFLASIREAACSFSRWNCEFRYIRPNGQEVYLKGSSLPEQRGDEMIFNGVLLDITDLKRAEDARRKGKAKYRFLTEKMNDIIWTADLDLSATYYSPSVEKILGFIPKERMKHTFNEIMTPESYDRALETLNTELEREKEHGADPERTVTLELECYHKDGTTRWMESIVRSIRDDTGKANGLLGVSRDITDRKLAEQELDKYRYHLEELIKERTDELIKANILLKQEIEVRKTTEAALRSREIELDDKRTSLEEMNTALRVLLKKRDEDKSDIETTIVSNLKTVVLPYVDKLMATDLKDNQKTFVSLIESYLKQITSSYIKELSSEYLGLTPSEIHVASLIKEGKGSKEIAAILNISLNTVLTHRYNIRSKIGLKNSKVNLQTYLSNLE